MGIYNKALINYFDALWKGLIWILTTACAVTVLIYLGFGFFAGHWNDWRIILPPNVLGVVEYFCLHKIYKEQHSVHKKKACVAVLFSILCLTYSVFFTRLSFLAFIFAVPVAILIPCGRKSLTRTFWLGEVMCSTIYLAHQIACHIIGYAYPDLGVVFSCYFIAIMIDSAVYIVSSIIADLFKSIIIETERFARESEKNYQKATHDPLTGAYNREKITIDVNKYDFMSVAFIDIDDFKYFNTVHTHEVGDGVLKDLVECLVREIGPLGRVYRYGGDEFTILGYADAEILTDKIRTASKDFKSKIWLDFKVEGTISAGVTAYDNALPYSTNVQLADKLMYEVKNSGKDSIIMR